MTWVLIIFTATARHYVNVKIFLMFLESLYIYTERIICIWKENKPQFQYRNHNDKCGCSYFLDLVAIPDFVSGAMENWGLITYRETSLLFDPKTSSASDKLWVTRVIAHELAHQVLGTRDILLVSVLKSIIQHTTNLLETT